MCPLRFILVFFSVIVAGYVTFKAMWSSDGDHLLSTMDAREHSEIEKKEDSILKQSYTKVVSGFWILVDMASGKYLWRIVASQKEKSSPS